MNYDLIKLICNIPEDIIETVLYDLNSAIDCKINELEERKLCITNERDGSKVINDEWHDYDQNTIRLENYQKEINQILSNNKEVA